MASAQHPGPTPQREEPTVRKALTVATRFASNDGANSFLLEASTGEKAIGDNEEISKRFMVQQIEYEAAGFIRSGSGTGGSPHRLFIS